MDSLHVSITDVSAVFEFSATSSVHVSMDAVRTMAVGTGAGSDSALAKDVAVRGLTVSVDGKVVFSLVECVLTLRNRSGEYCVDVRIPDPLRVSLGDAVVRIVSELRAEAALWTCAAVYRRPDAPASAESRCWWRYAVRVVMRSGGGRIEDDFGLARLRRCAEYHRLHIDRLNRAGRASAATRDKCYLLESQIDVETLLLLRARARKAVLVEKATQFATEDWLSWMLIGSSDGGNDTEQIGQDIRAAISALNASESEDESLDNALSALGTRANAISTAWSQATVSLDVSRVVISFTSAEDDLRVDVVVDRPQVCAHVDASFSSYQINASIADIAVGDDRTQYLQRDMRPPAAQSPHAISTYPATFRAEDRPTVDAVCLDPATPTVDPLLRMSLRRLPKSRCAVADVHLAAVALHIDVSRLSPLAVIVSRLAGAHDVPTNGVDGYLATVIPSSLSPPSIASSDAGRNASSPKASSLTRADLSDSMSRSTKRSKSPPAGGRGRKMKANGLAVLDCRTHLRVDGLRLVLSSGLSVRDTECRLRDALSLVLSNVSLDCACDSTGLSAEGATLSMSLSLMSCVVANDTLGGNNNSICADEGDYPDGNDGSINDSAGFISIVSMSEPLLRDMLVELRLAVDSLDVRCPHVFLRVWDTEVDAMSTLLRSVAEEITIERASSGRYESRVGVERPTAPYTRSAWKRRVSDSLSVATAIFPLLNPGIDATTGRDTSETEPFRVDIAIPSVRVAALCGPCDPPEPVAVLIARGLRVSIRGGTLLSVLAREVTMTEPCSDGSIRFRPKTGRSHAISMATVPDGVITVPCAALRFELSDMDANVNTGMMTRLAGFAMRVVRLIAQQPSHLHRTSSVASSLVGNVPVESNVRRVVASRVRFVVSMRSTRVQMTTSFASAIIRTEGLHFEGIGSGWKGHLEMLDLTDLSGRSGIYAHAIRSRDEEKNSCSGIRRLRFSTRPGHVSLQVTSVNLVVFRSFIEEVASGAQELLAGVKEGEAAFFSLGDRVAVDQRSGDSGPLNDISGKSIIRSHSSSGVADTRFTFRGNRIMVVLPVSASDASAAGVDVHDATIVISPSTLHISGRKLRLMTSVGNSQSLHRRPSRPSDWSVVVTSMDLDVNRSDSDGIVVPADSGSPVPSISARREKQKWNVWFQSKAILLTRIQISLISAIFGKNLLAPTTVSSAASDATSKHESLSSMSAPATVIVERHESDINPMYKSVTISLQSPGVVVELLRDEREGWVSAALATITLGPIHMSSDTLMELRGAITATSVSRFSLDVTSIRMEDRHEEIPEAFRLIFFANVDHRSSNASLKMDGDNLSGTPCFRLARHTRRDQISAAQSKTTVTMGSPRLILRPDLLAALVRFLSPGVDDDVVQDTRSGFGAGMYSAAPLVPISKTPPLSTASTSASLSSDAEESHVEEEHDTVVSKISVSIHSAQLFVVEKPIGDNTHGVRASCERIKISLFQTADGSLTSDSTIRVRSIILSICMASVLSVAPALCSTSGNIGTQALPQILEVGRERRLNFQACHDSSSMASDSRTKYGSPGACPESVRTSVLQSWSWEADVYPDLVHLGALTIRLPAMQGGIVTIAIPSVVVDCPVQDMAHLVILAPRLDLLFEGDPDAPIVSPPISIRVGMLACVLRIPRSQLAHSGAGGSKPSLLRATCGIDVDMEENISSIALSLNELGLTTFDGDSGEWDLQALVAPCWLALYINSRSLEGSLRIVSPLIVTLSPVIIKTFANLAFAMRSALSDATDNTPPGERAVSTLTIPPVALVDAVRVSVIVDLVEVFLISTTLRLRVEVKDVSALVVLPLARTSLGKLACRVGNIFVRNETLGLSAWGHGCNWALMVSPAPDVLPQGSLRHMSAITGYVNKMLPRPDLGLQRRTQRDSAVAIMKWGGEAGDVGIRLGLTGLDVCVEAAIVRDLMQWSRMVASALDDAASLHAKRRMMSREKENSQVDMHSHREYDIVIEPVILRVSARAPPSLSQRQPDRRISLSSLSRRVAELLLGSEHAAGLRLSFPRIAVDGSFAIGTDIAAHIRHEFGLALASRAFLSQIGWQLPSLVRLVRVAVMTYLRSSAEQAPTLVDRYKALVDEGQVGLLSCIDNFNQERQCVANTRLRHAASPKWTQRTRNDTIGISEKLSTSLSNIEVLDIAGLNSADAGHALFDDLKLRDATLRRTGETFRCYTPFSASHAVLVTSLHLLAVRLSDDSIVEPRVPVDAVTGYSLRDDKCVIVHCQRLSPLHVSRDTGSMIEAMRYTLQCDCAATAALLVATLPVRGDP
jgi:hypothetical protein